MQNDTQGKHISTGAGWEALCIRRTRTRKRTRTLLCIRRTLCRHVTIGTPMVIFAVWLFLTIGTLLVYWCYGRPLSVSGRPCYILPVFYLFIIFLWPPYSPALVNGSSRKFYTWWTLSVIREVTNSIFSWSSLNYRVGQKVTKFGVFSDPTRKLSALTPERGRIL